MACESMIRIGQSMAQRKKEVADALTRLKAALEVGTVTLKVGANGAIVFVGTWQREGVSDVCAYRAMVKQAPELLRRIAARAEVMAGRQIDPRMVAAGVHSHDGGRSWGKH